MEPRTQKAKGLVALKNFKDQFLFGGKVETLPFKLISSEDDLNDPLFYIKDELFGRPCPVDPQHGFVDSRPVKDKPAAFKLFKLAQKADPQAEMLLMPYVQADINALWTPGRLSIGPGNDGATSGHKSIAIRTTEKLPFKSDAIVKASGVAAPAVPYLEFVGRHQPASAGLAEKQPLYIVQLRGGPAVGNLGPDYCPQTIKVKQVVQAKGDLIEWKETCASFKPGTVVLHIGGNMSSHYAIHCVEHDIPIFTSGQIVPKVGDTVPAIPVKKPEKDIDSVIKGLAIGVNYPVDYESAVLIVLGALHNSVQFDKDESRLFGVAVMLALKLGFAACFGEARHKENKHGLQRNQIYQQAWADLASHVQKFNHVRELFWKKKWAPHFGGKAWGQCSDATADLWNAVVKLCRNRTKESLTAVVDALNVVINCAHNNGWWFNKFFPSHSIAQQWFDVAAQSPASPLIVTMRHLYRIQMLDAKIEGLIADIAKQPAVDGGESAAPVKGKSKSVVNKPTEGAEYGPFKIVYVHSGKPWFVYANGSRIARCAGLWGVAKCYLEHHNMEVTDEARKTVMKQIEQTLGKTKLNAKTSKDGWIIPPLAA